MWSGPQKTTTDRASRNSCTIQVRFQYDRESRAVHAATRSARETWVARLTRPAIRTGMASKGTKGIIITPFGILETASSKWVPNTKLAVLLVLVLVLAEPDEHPLRAHVNVAHQGDLASLLLAISLVDAKCIVPAERTQQVVHPRQILGLAKTV